MLTGTMFLHVLLGQSAVGKLCFEMLGALWGTKGLIPADSSSGFAVFKKARFSIKLGAKFILRFLEIRKCCFCQQVQRFVVFSVEKGLSECSVCLRLWGSPRALFSDSSNDLSVFQVCATYRKPTGSRSPQSQSIIDRFFQEIRSSPSIPSIHSTHSNHPSIPAIAVIPSIPFIPSIHSIHPFPRT